MLSYLYSLGDISNRSGSPAESVGPLPSAVKLHDIDAVIGRTLS